MTSKIIIKFIKTNYVFFLSFGALFLYYSLWLLAFYPAVMSPDSISQWNEALYHTYTNASPFLYSLLISGLQLIHDTPALIGIFQIFILTAIVSFALNYFNKRGANNFFLLLSGGLFIIIPQFAIYNVTVWKDVPYSYFLLLLAFMTYLFVNNDNKKRNFIYSTILVVLLALVSLFRFNGIFLIPFVPACLFLIKKINFKNAFIIFLSSTLLYLLFNNGLGYLLNVKKAPLMKEGLAVRLVGSVYQLKNPNLTFAEREVFNKMIPEADWQKYYDCSSINVLFYNYLTPPRKLSVYDQIDPDPNFVNKWHEFVLSATLKNPEAFVKDKVCLSNSLLGLKSYYKYETGIYTLPGEIGIEQTPKSYRLHSYFLKYLDWTINNFVRSYIFWGTWLALLLFLTTFAVSIIKKRWGAFVYSGIVLWAALTTISVSPAADYRYVYFVYVCLPLVLLIYFFDGSKGRVISE